MKYDQMFLMALEHERKICEPEYRSSLDRAIAKMKGGGSHKDIYWSFRADHLFFVCGMRSLGYVVQELLWRRARYESTYRIETPDGVWDGCQAEIDYDAEAIVITHARTGRNWSLPWSEYRSTWDVDMTVFTYVT